MSSRILAALLFCAGFGAAQTSQFLSPDCTIGFNFTGAGQSTVTTGCGQNLQGVVDWRVIYFTDGFSAISLAVQSANDASGTPGSWSTFGGTVIDGVNPNTATGRNQTQLFGFFPWVRVTLTSATGSGTVKGAIYGCKQPGCTGGTFTGSGGGGGGTSCVSMTPCIVIGPDAPGSAPTQNPVELGSFDGTNTQRVKSDVQGRLIEGAYPTTAPVTLTTSGLTRVITHGSGTTTLSHISLSFTAATDFQLEYGTGTNCGTGTTALTGLYKTVLAVALDKTFFVPTGQDLCVNLGSVVTGGGLVVYAQP